MKNSIPRLLITILGLVALIPAIEQAQTPSFVPVTDEVLKNPSPNDWLMFSRTYDAQRFSPLSQINKQNVGQLRLAWKRDMGTGGSQESIPLVYRGVMYSFAPPATIQALDAASGNLLWEYKRQGQSKTKGLAIYEDMIYFTTPDCAPCKTIQRPAINRISSLLGEELEVVEIDATERPDLAKVWGVMSVPTTFVLDARGEARYVNNGVARAEKLLEQIQTL